MRHIKIAIGQYNQVDHIRKYFFRATSTDAHKCERIGWRPGGIYYDLYDKIERWVEHRMGRNILDSHSVFGFIHTPGMDDILEETP